MLFAILAFSANPTPAYLRDTTVRWLGSAALGALFVALLGTLAALYPRASRYQEHNLSAMRRARAVSYTHLAPWAAGARC